MKVKRIRVSFTVILLAFAAILISACASTRAIERDSLTESSIRNSYAYQKSLQGDNIVVNAKEGTVTLSGTVPDASHKFLAQNVAESAPGVKKVDNKLEVEGGTPREGSDAWLGAKVKAELMMRPDMGSAKTDVYVKNGIVTLQGNADNDAQKNLATEYARNVKGVKDVVNEMTVASAAGAQPLTSSPVMNDASLTAQIENALDANTATSGIDADVETTNGIVTVTGFADNQAQKELVTRIISDINGVKGVVNELTIQQPAVLIK